MNQRLRTLLVLGRVSNLPTVWSDCLAGWWLGGDGTFWKLPLLLFGVSLLYTGGMFLNDAFDEEFDRLRRPGRPIPSGKISAAAVWSLGFGQLAFGLFVLLWCGKLAAAGAMVLALFIVLYDFAHKFLMASPWLMGACRFWVYVIASATGFDGLNGFAIFGGVALAFYVVGLTYVARRESSRGRIPLWPWGLMAAPILLALAINTGEFRLPAIWISVVLGLWVARYARYIFAAGDINVGWIVSNLLAGIVLVDWLAVAPQIQHWLGAAIFLALFGLTKWLQKFVPAT
ncbi:MAG TPA: UbiA family prenyltransferase [Candidatus Acidoferrales bacterium]|nr:UbiA family prenyltransferase [Candidatus Acidoferrales bacterium]